VKLRWPEKEVIGPPDCPLMHRWTFINGGPKSVKLMVHHFLPNADDRDVHDHPRAFYTFVVRGHYDDMEPCPYDRSGANHGDLGGGWICRICDGRNVVLNERMKPGMLRLRPAAHRHRTKVGPRGCWTIVLMGPLVRDWGFWRRGKWWLWKNYENEFGFAMRCEDLDKEYRK
jgi:hypothetical protein